MAGFSVERCLETAVKNHASDLYLTAGEEPKIRINKTLRSLQTDELTCKVLVKATRQLTPKRNYEELQRTGRTVYSFTFGDAGRFRVSVAKHGNGFALALRYLPPAPPLLGKFELPFSSHVEGLCRRARG